MSKPGPHINLLLEQFKLPPFRSRAEARTYWTKNDERKFEMRRFFMYFGALAFAAHGALDLTAGGAQSSMLLTLRLAAVILMLMLAGAFNKRRTALRPDTIVLAYLLVPAMTIIAMTVMVEPGTAADTYPFGLVILVAYGGSVLVPRFVKLVCLCVIVYLTYMMAVPFSAISNSAFVVNGFFVTVGLAAICIGSLTRERLERKQMRIEQSIVELNIDLQFSREEAFEARDAAVSAHETQAKFITSVSHELRTPLNAIIGFSDLMINEIDGPVVPASYREYVGDIHRAGQGLLLNINDLLDVHRLNAGKMSWTDQRFSVRDMMKDSVSICRHDAEAAKVTLVLEPIERDIDAFGDSIRMSQVITNLLTNAIKFTDPGGQVTVQQALDMSGELRISITDTGIGIAREDLARIKDPFQQAEDGTLAKKKGGLGLGLAIVDGILQQINGRFEIESEFGIGTTCHVYIPHAKLFLDDIEPHLVRA